jgi:hypothetical protein
LSEAKPNSAVVMGFAALNPCYAMLRLSWPGMAVRRTASRPSTPCFRSLKFEKDVDARDKRGHDEAGDGRECRVI